MRSLTGEVSNPSGGIAYTASRQHTRSILSRACTLRTSSILSTRKPSSNCLIAEAERLSGWYWLRWQSEDARIVAHYFTPLDMRHCVMEPACPLDFLIEPYGNPRGSRSQQDDETSDVGRVLEQLATQD